MEITELLAQIKKSLILVLILCSIGKVTAQHRIDNDVTFYLKGKNNYAKLNPFLGYFKFDFRNLENCDNSSGVVKFQVTPKGKIASIEAKGNLPSVLIDSIKKRVLLTEDKWRFSDAIHKKNENIVFYYPIYIDPKAKCNNKIHESYYLLMKLLKHQSVLSIDNNEYIIEPLLWFQYE